jgi:hypothetical protein
MLKKTSKSTTSKNKDLWISFISKKHFHYDVQYIWPTTCLLLYTRGENDLEDFYIVKEAIEKRYKTVSNGLPSIDGYACSFPLKKMVVDEAFFKSISFHKKSRHITW